MNSLCGQCCFYREVTLKSGRMRRLCMLTGDKNPQLVQRNCHFIAGNWGRIDEILGLQKSSDCGNLDFPNQMKLGDCFSRDGRKTADIKFVAGDSSALPKSYTKGQSSCPGNCKVPVVHLAREHEGCPFHV